MRPFRHRSFCLTLSGSLLILIASASAADPAIPVKKLTLATFAIKGDLPEGPTSAGIFGDLQTNLRETIGRIDAAAKDEKVAGIVLQLRDPDIGLAKVNELRGAIARVRKAGKKVYADVHSAASRDYLIACACDEIIMPPSGELMITGLAAEVTFFKGLFDKLGVTADFIQIGDFKGAAEPLTRTQMSPEFRRQYEAVIDDYYQQMIQSIAVDRKLDPAKVKELIDQGLFTADGAKAARLADRVCYQDELADQLKAEMAATEIAFDKNYGKKKVDTDFSGITGFMKLMEMLMGAEPAKSASPNPKIAVIYAVGTIMTGESTSSIMGESVLGGDTLVKAFRQAEGDDKVKAIVLRVDSPGGSALASDLVWREVVRSKKPVIASMGDVAASGGYYISMGTRKIYAEPGTLTGSIGVVGGKIALKGLMDKLGITTEVISRGKNSGTLSMNEPFTDAQRDAWKRVMSEIYRQFTTKAAAGRKMDMSKLEGLAQGRVFTGRQAVANGLADALGTLDDAVADAKNTAGLKPEEKVDLLILPQSKSFLEQFLGPDPMEAEARAIAPRLVDGLRTAELLRRLFAEPAVTIMPCRVKIK